MSMYQPGIPTGSVPLDQDYLNLQNNFQQLDTSFGLDHTPFSVNTIPQPAGYHTNIHLIPFSTTTTNAPNNQPVVQPTATGGYGQVWSAQINDGINVDEALYFLTGGGRNLQLTSNFVPQVTTNGFTFVPGGVIIQWGTLSAISETTTPVTFAGLGCMAFPNNCFIVIPAVSTTGGSASTLNITLLTKTGFSYYNTSGSTRTYFWFALGN